MTNEEAKDEVEYYLYVNCPPTEEYGSWPIDGWPLESKVKDLERRVERLEERLRIGI